MNKYNDLIKKNNLEVNKITIKGNTTILDTSSGKYIIKPNNNSVTTYKYLLSRSFDYFPRIIDYDEEYILFEYINDIKYEISQKAEDYIRLLSLLHLKTSYFKEISNDDIKRTYELIRNRIIDVEEYYNFLIDKIESKEYMSPSEYLIARNISIIFSAINYSKGKLDTLYETIKNDNKKRVVTLYNNIDLNNMIKSIDKMYFTSFENVKADNPIYDLVSFYNLYYDSFDFSSLLDIYCVKYPLLQDELDLLLVLVSIPEKVSVTDNIDSFIISKRLIDKIYITLRLLNSKEEKEGDTHKDENNKK